VRCREHDATLERLKTDRSIEFAASVLGFGRTRLLMPLAAETIFIVSVVHTLELVVAVAVVD
jgi:hypothetical protein